MNIELVDPIDYEKFVRENKSLLENSPMKELLLFPENDISVTLMPRKFRTVQIPVPGPAKLVTFMGVGVEFKVFLHCQGLIISFSNCSLFKFILIS